MTTKTIETKTLLVCGVIAGPLFVIGFLVEGATRAGYDPLRHPAPEPLAVALGDLARATEALAAYLEAPDSPEGARRLALKAAGGAAALLREREDLVKDLTTNAFIYFYLRIY